MYISGIMNNIVNKIRNLDAYPKINEDFYSRTLSGGLITLASSVVMLLLFVSELSESIVIFVLYFYLLVLIFSCLAANVSCQSFFSLFFSR